MPRLVSDFVRIATSGRTADGREISPEWVDQMAATYDPEVYGARIWLEHMRGLLAGGPFDALGDVVALEARDVAINGDTRRGLFARISPTPSLEAMVAARQKVYTSVEVDPDFAGTGQAYLVGLGVTDSPAALGTTALAFTVAGRFGELAASPGDGSHLTDPEPLEGLSFSSPAAPQPEPAPARGDEADSAPDTAAQISELAALHAQFQRLDGETAAHLAEREAAQTELAAQVSELAAQVGRFADLAARLTALEEAMDTTPSPDYRPRPPATGGHRHARTDC